jgi:predicted lipoprotein with Yx(FWY)xxD motif
MQQHHVFSIVRLLATASLLALLTACQEGDNSTQLLVTEPVAATLITGAAVPPGTSVAASQAYNRVTIQASAPTDSDIREAAGGLGSILADKAGQFSLYVFSKDSPGTSVCNVSDTSQCANVWPPLFAATTAQPKGEYTIIKRADGSRQWTYRGYPLYFFNGDANRLPDLIPGDANGFLVGGVWFVVRPDPFTAGVVAGSNVWTGKGSILNIGVDAAVKITKPLTELNSTQRRSIDGLTLYTFDKDPGNGTSVCNDDCARKWPPLYADLFSIPPNKDFTVITRANGTFQWAYRGKPLYFWFEDQLPGDALGRTVPNWSLATR